MALGSQNRGVKRAGVSPRGPQGGEALGPGSHTVLLQPACNWRETRRAFGGKLHSSRVSDLCFS